MTKTGIACVNNQKEDQREIIFDLEKSPPIDGQPCWVVALLGTTTGDVGCSFRHAVGCWDDSRRDWVSLWHEDDVLVLETVLAGLAAERVIWAPVDHFDTPRDLIRCAYRFGLVT